MKNFFKKDNRPPSIIGAGVFIAVICYEMYVSLDIYGSDVEMNGIYWLKLIISALVIGIVCRFFFGIARSTQKTLRPVFYTLTALFAYDAFVFAHCFVLREFSGNLSFADVYLGICIVVSVIILFLVYIFSLYINKFKK